VDFPQISADKTGMGKSYPLETSAVGPEFARKSEHRPQRSGETKNSGKKQRPDVPSDARAQ